MSKQSFKEALNLAQKLAEFANLTPEGVNDFRNDNPEFVPAGLWTTSSRVGDAPTITPRWQEDQQLLRKAWLNRFPPDDCIRLIVEWANFYWGDESVQRTSEALSKDGCRRSWRLSCRSLKTSSNRKRSRPSKR